jgi:hypothetical protein
MGGSRDEHNGARALSAGFSYEQAAEPASPAGWKPSMDKPSPGWHMRDRLATLDEARNAHLYVATVRRNERGILH